MTYYQLDNFELWRNPESGDWRLWVATSANYIDIIRRAFPHLSFGSQFSDRNHQWRCGVYIKGLGNDPSDISNFCKYLQNAVYLPNNLDECFALGMHSSVTSGEPRRTALGDLVYAAKPYRDSEVRNDEAEQVLGEALCEFIQRHPTYRHASAVAAVPPSPSKNRPDLPSCLASWVSIHLRLDDFTSCTTKASSTHSMKDCEGLSEKRANIKGVFRVQESKFFENRDIIVIDDIYHSGATICEFGQTLKRASARRVLGLTLTKTLRSG